MLRLQADAKKAGFSDVVYLDAKTDTYLEEVSSCNIFTVTGNTIRTPALRVRCSPHNLCSFATQQRHCQEQTALVCVHDPARPQSDVCSSSICAKVHRIPDDLS